MKFVARKGWIAYAVTAAGVVIEILLTHTVIQGPEVWKQILPPPWNQSVPEVFKNNLVEKIAQVSAIVGAFLLCIDIARLRKYKLFYDTKGVWISSGIFPWTRSKRGMNWRDIKSITYVPSLFGDLTNSHTVCLLNKQEDKLIWMSHAFNGKKLSGKLNGMPQKGRAPLSL